MHGGCVGLTIARRQWSVFDARTAENHPEFEWITLEDPRARSVVGELRRWVAKLPLPSVRIAGLPDTVCGMWSLWEISLLADEFTRRRFLTIFVNDAGRTFLPTAKRIWDLLLTEQVELIEASVTPDADSWFDRSKTAALAQGERVFVELLEEHKCRVQEERERAQYAYDARHQAIGPDRAPECARLSSQALEGGT